MLTFMVKTVTVLLHLLIVLLLQAPLSLLPLRCWYEGRSSFELCKPVSASGDRLLGTLTIVLLLSFTLIAVVATPTERFLSRVSFS